MIWFKTSSFHQSDYIPSLSKVFNFVYDQSQSDNFFEPGVLTNSRVLSVQNLEYWAKKKSTILLERFFVSVRRILGTYTCFVLIKKPVVENV